MLRYSDNKDQKAGDSMITRIGELVDFERVKQAIQPYLNRPVDSYIEEKSLQWFHGTLYAAGKIEFKCDDNGNFIWPKEYPLHFKTSSIWSKYAEVPNVANKIDISSWVFPESENIDSFVYGKGGNNIKEINVSGGDTSSCENLMRTFDEWDGLKRLDLSTWDLTNIVKAYKAFANMGDLREIIFNESGMPRLTNTNCMFYNSGYADSILDLRYVKTGNINHAPQMFKLSGFKEIDLRGWKFTNDCAFDDFAYGCNNLQIFNGVKLRYEFSHEVNDLKIDGTSTCIDIIKNPDKYKQYLVK